MGKTMYCQKLAYDWATKQEEWDPSFPEIEVLLLIKCNEMKSSIWEAIDDQLLPTEIDDQAKECFFEFIRKNQSKVLLVLDGLDEMNSSELKATFDLVDGKELSGCQVVLTEKLWYANKFENLFLYEFTKSRLNTTLVCVLCEDFDGVFPTSRTQLYNEIVPCFLRRYEKKQGRSSKNEDLMGIYKEELMPLGRVALQSLVKGQLHFEEQESDGTFIALSKFGFLSLQAGASKRNARARYAFLHKSFQEFFSGFYLACQILDGGIDCDSVVADQRFKHELKQVFLFTIGILATKSKRTTESLIECVAANINLIGQKSNGDISGNFLSALDCTLECTSLAYTLGTHLNLANLDLSGKRVGAYGAASLPQALAANSSISNLDLSGNWIGAYGAASLSQALASNFSVTNLKLGWNCIGDSGATSLSQALAINASLTNLDLRWNEIGASGVASLCKVLATSNFLTSLNLGLNCIAASGAASLSQSLAANSSLTSLDLSENWIGDSGAAFLAQALAVNSSLTNLNLS